ncbi:MAG: M20/M25/M40 family metallo-hydrolase [Puniceicoccales bacterium]|jgi:acetylornithine deacetylase/succinyl-diaminopimelate desuccinylase-like protein|nr:M20/M25/M40 family metallo-hydrolase [Puniceicoccales bacterium]
MPRDYLQILRSLIAIGSVSADRAAGGELERAADFLAAELSAIGFAARCVDGYGPAPIVWAVRGPRAAKVSIIIYGHYDVQPAEPLGLWQTDPFALEERGGLLLGRGAADDKGPLVAALAALYDVGQLENVKITVLFEGAEEIGSVGFGEFLRDSGDQIDGHVAVVADGGCPDESTAALITGLRGLISFELSIRTAERDIHSGYGGCTPNALHELMKLCGKFHGEGGEVAIPGFYDGILAPGPGEIEAFRLLDCRRNFPAELGVRSQLEVFRDMPPSAVHGLMPSLEINGAWGGHLGSGCKTIIPAEASAKFTVRTVPGQRRELLGESVAEFARANCPPYGSVALNTSYGGNAYAIDWPHVGEKFSVLFGAMERSMRLEFGGEPLRLREGGSIGVVGDFRELLAADSIILGIVPISSNIHAPNENWTLGAFGRTRRSLVRFLEFANELP